MKFQNTGMHGFWRINGRMDNPKPICPINCFEVGGIITPQPIFGVQANSVLAIQTVLYWEKNAYAYVHMLYREGVLTHSSLESYW